MKRLLALLLAALASCVPQKQWRSKPFYAAPPAERSTAVEERFVIPHDLNNQRLYSLAFVEFKNNGDPWDPKQLDEALQAIDED